MMKYKAFKYHRRRTRKLFNEWVYKLGLEWYEIDVVYHRSKKDFRRTWGVGRYTDMAVRTDWRYMHATVGVCVPLIASLSDEKLEKVVVHELTHILLNEAREKGLDHEERATTFITKAILYTRNVTRRDLQKAATKV